MRITEDRKGRLLETLWELNDRFQTGEDDEALGHMFTAITQFAEEAALDERDKIVGLIDWRIKIDSGFIEGAMDAGVEPSSSVLSSLSTMRSLKRRLG